MARHADPNARHFWRSLATATLRGAGALVLVVGVFAGLALIGRPTDPGPVMLQPEGDDAGPPPNEAAAEGEAEEDARPDMDDLVEDSFHDDGAETPDDADSEDEPGDNPEGDSQAVPSADGVTVQVLDGAGDPAVADAVADALAEAGYEIVAVNTASRAYEATTVFYTDGHESDARALVEGDERFVEAAPNPNLAETVDLHVVAGTDWAP